MEISSNKSSKNIVKIIYGCLQLYLWSKFPQNKPICVEIFQKPSGFILLWKFPQIKWSQITQFWGNFEPKKIFLWKDFNFFHLCRFRILETPFTLLESLIGDNMEYHFECIQPLKIWCPAWTEFSEKLYTLWFLNPLLSSFA